MTQRSPSQGDKAQAADPAYEVYQRVATDVGGNITYALIEVGFIWLIRRSWPFLAKAVFWIGAAVGALHVLHVLYVTTLGVMAATFGARASNWLWGANVARVVESTLLAFAVWLGARLLGYL